MSNHEFGHAQACELAIRPGEICVMNIELAYLLVGPLGLVMPISGLSRCHGCIVRVCVITKNVLNLSGEQISWLLGKLGCYHPN